jgi:hypothetical protein
MRADRNLSAGTNLQAHASTGRRITGLATAVAPPGVVQAAAFNYGPAPQTATFPSPVTSGNLLVAAVGLDAFGVATVTDGLGSSWAAAVVNNPGSFFAVGLHWAKAAASGTDTVTVHTTNSAQTVGQLYEVSGVASATPVDQTGVSGTGAVAAVVAPNLAGLAGAADLVIYWVFNGSQNTVPVGGIWTSDFTATVAGGHFVAAAYATTGPSVTGPTFNPGVNAQFVCAGAAFHP